MIGWQCKIFSLLFKIFLTKNKKNKGPKIEVKWSDWASDVAQLDRVVADQSPKTLIEIENTMFFFFLLLLLLSAIAPYSNKNKRCKPLHPWMSRNNNLRQHPTTLNTSLLKTPFKPISATTMFSKSSPSKFLFTQKLDEKLKNRCFFIWGSNLWLFS